MCGGSDENPLRLVGQLVVGRVDDGYTAIVILSRTILFGE